MQIPVAFDESNGGEIFWMHTSFNMAIYAIEMIRLEINGNLVILQPVNFQLFSEKDVITKYKVNQSFMSSPSFIVLHYYLVGYEDVAQYTVTNALFNAEIENLQLRCIFFEDDFFKPMRMKSDGSCLYQAVASHVISCCLDDVWTGRFSPSRKTGIKLVTYEMVNSLKQFISQKDSNLLQKHFS